MLRFRRGHDFSLKELISKALDKNGLTEVAAAIESYRRVPVSAANQESVDYAGRVLTEEVERQFGDEKRLTAELVLNAVDAKPPNYPGHFDKLVQAYKVKKEDARLPQQAAQVHPQPV